MPDAAAPVTDAVGARAVPRHADEEAAVGDPSRPATTPGSQRVRQLLADATARRLVELDGRRRRNRRRLGFRQRSRDTTSDRLFELRTAGETEGHRPHLLGETREQQEELLLGREVAHQPCLAPDLQGLGLLQDDVGARGLLEFDRLGGDLPGREAALDVTDLGAAHVHGLDLNVGFDTDRALAGFDRAVGPRVLGSPDSRVCGSTADRAHRLRSPHHWDDHRRRGFGSPP